MCTLLLANFLLPVLAPKEEAEDDEEETEELMRTKIEIMRTVIERLMADSTETNDRETKIVVSSYNNRIRLSLIHIWIRFLLLGITSTRGSVSVLCLLPMKTVKPSNSVPLM